MYTFNWALTAFRSESYIGSATALPDIKNEFTEGIKTIANLKSSEDRITMVQIMC